MKVEQLYTKCLSQSSYYIESNGEAVIIDPIRESDPYLDFANSDNAKVKYIFETHFHADFVSGHIDLAKKSGAQIVYGPGAITDYEVLIAQDGQTFSVGDISFKVIHTPGHTLESTSFLLFDENGNEYAVFTGDTLFVGDVGRPDLSVESDKTIDDLAALLYDSIHNKLSKLNSETLVYPGHGAGSSCGKNLGKETWSTIGEQKKNNYALLEKDKSKFIALVTEGLSEPPKYFFEDAKINQNGYISIDEVLNKNTVALNYETFKKVINEGVTILDTRSPDSYEKGHIYGSINIGLGGQYAIWVGTLIEINAPIVVIAEPNKEEEAILRLARVGYENVKGYLKGGIQSWTEDLIASITIEANELPTTDVNILDVRKQTEFETGHLSIAKNYSLQNLQEQATKLEKKETYYVHCQSGYRSSIACSLLEQKGFNNVINVHGGYLAISNTDSKCSI